jgi:hypothetical protein
MTLVKETNDGWVDAETGEPVEVEGKPVDLLRCLHFDGVRVFLALTGGAICADCDTEQPVTWDYVVPDDIEAA